MDKAQKQADRRCGECAACCRLMPVSEIGKAAGKRCVHQRHSKGCAAYADRPLSCREWSCLWLTDPGTAALRRPDRSGYVLDSLPDFSRARNEVTGVETVFEVVQIWASDRGVKIESELIPYLEARHAGAAIRSESAGVVVMVPPWVSPTGAWLLQEGTISEPQHTVEQVETALGRLARDAEQFALFANWCWEETSLPLPAS